MKFCDKRGNPLHTDPENQPRKSNVSSTIQNEEESQ